MGKLIENINLTKRCVTEEATGSEVNANKVQDNLVGKTLKEFPTQKLNFPIRAKLEYDTQEDSWWFAFYPEGARMALGSADMYKIPDDLRQSMNLDSLLTKGDSD